MINKKISLNEPNFIGNESKYLDECIKTNWVSGSGKFVKKFEDKVSNILKVKYSTGIINGTCALDLALKVLNCKNENEILIPTLTFIAPVNSIIYNNCYPVFMDSNKYFNIDEEKLIEFINHQTYFRNGKTYNKKTKRVIFALIVVHVWGNAVNLDKIYNLCKKRNIKIIEDASESFGSKYTIGKFKNKYTGTIGDIGCFSFNTNKIITCGSGGMIVTNKKIFFDRAVYLANQAKDDTIKYIHNDVGYNYRLNNLNAAVGFAQLEKFSIIYKKKKEIFNYYKFLLRNSKNIKLVETPPYADNNRWMILVTFNKLKISIIDTIKYLSKKNIEARPVWHLNHKQKKFSKFETYNISHSNKLIKNSLCIPSSSGLTKKHMINVVKVLLEVHEY